MAALAKQKSEPDKTVAVIERKDAPGVWSVEEIDYKDDGACHVAVFYGPKSEARAREYAKLKYDR